jgi:hypothetical protein
MGGARNGQSAFFEIQPIRTRMGDFVSPRASQNEETDDRAVGVADFLRRLPNADKFGVIKYAVALIIGCGAGKFFNRVLAQNFMLDTELAPCKNTPVSRLTDPPGAVDPQSTLCLMPPRPIIACKSSDGSAKNQTCKDGGPLTLDRSRTVDEEISAKVIDYLDRNDPKNDDAAPEI